MTKIVINVFLLSKNDKNGPIFDSGQAFLVRRKYSHLIDFKN